jgi:predicted Fe-Mo cluster-binding NifX family protein
MNIVIPVFKNRVSPVFDWCSNLLVVEIQSGREVGRSEVAAAITDPVRQADQVVNLGAGLVVCGGIGEILLGLIEAKNIHIIPGVSGDIDDVLAALSSGELPHPRFMMPGCGAHLGQHRLRGGFGGKSRKHTRTQKVGERRR